MFQVNSKKIYIERSKVKNGIFIDLTYYDNKSAIWQGNRKRQVGIVWWSDMTTNKWVSTACKLPMKFEPIKEKIKLAPTLIQSITKLVQILNFVGSLHTVLSNKWLWAKAIKLQRKKHSTLFVKKKHCYDVKPGIFWKWKLVWSPFWYKIAMSDRRKVYITG